MSRDHVACHSPTPPHSNYARGIGILGCASNTRNALHGHVECHFPTVLRTSRSYCTSAWFPYHALHCLSSLLCIYSLRHTSSFQTRVYYYPSNGRHSMTTLLYHNAKSLLPSACHISTLQYRKKELFHNYRCPDHA